MRLLLDAFSRLVWTVENPEETRLRASRIPPQPGTRLAAPGSRGLLKELGVFGHLRGFLPRDLGCGAWQEGLLGVGRRLCCAAQRGGTGGFPRCGRFPGRCGETFLLGKPPYNLYMALCMERNQHLCRTISLHPQDTSHGLRHERRARGQRCSVPGCLGGHKQQLGGSL